MPLSIVEYQRQNGSNPYREWFLGLSVPAATKVSTAVARIELGNTANVKWFDGIGECRIDWGPGYRIYLAMDGARVVVLLGGGTKKRQHVDIERSKVLWSEVRIQGSQERKMMSLTVPSTSTIERVRNEHAFAKSLLVEAVTLFLNGEPDTSRLLLRDLVNGTLGFEQLAVETGTPAKSLHRMLSVKGNPNMDNLSTLFHVIAKHLGVTITKTRSSIKAA